MNKILFAFFCVFLFVGCSSFTEVTYRTIAVTENPVGDKIGQINWEQGGTLEAAKSAGITKISTVSFRNTSTYVTYYWPAIIGGDVQTVLTRSLQEIIVTGE
ncbi:MAG: hypothetical protein FWC24_06385 [Treponema sp.]|nr:hypothetical protein [Treponema sp.]